MSGRPENLRVHTSEELSRFGSKGGKAAAAANRERKMLSQLYGEFLASKFNVKIRGERHVMTGHELVKEVAFQILLRRDSSSVAMLKEIREATEGTKASLSGVIGVQILDDIK